MKLNRICLVDDANGIHALANRLFVQKLGKELVAAHSAFEALEVIRNQKPDACFIDVEMPDINGLQLVSILRANPEYVDMPIAMLSGASSIFDKEKGLLVGANIYLTKPFSLESIESALGEMEAFYE
ncbi:hypothetical protein LCGC14_0169870 [marine sediment metagenome]|jgi:twitching motility two-component system response regulator PilG|uniref:Response regulatory domain-containing protein n=1 Tax=marine sediment metagenome TaxID=412755 RepID=A0A0F9XUN8_9ZZZZ|nr:response regulator [Oceanospirillaceae bacterium]|tara:strand:+ start:314 stop:694 length:381 start_codon:yes stop_codon:yes gene_type:complete